MGVDVTKKLIDICPPHKNVKFICAENFFEKNKLIFDVVWVSLVFGGLPDSQCAIVAKNIEAALEDNGLLFILESTGVRYMEGPWRTRTRQQLLSIFPQIKLKHIGTYWDATQEISILAGRKLYKNNVKCFHGNNKYENT